MIYHLLDEPFSAYTGLALSSIAANIMRFDENSVVVCSNADDTWGFSTERIMIIPRLGLLANGVGWRFAPGDLRRQVIRSIFSPILSKLQAGDIVWCHNWHYVAAALQNSVSAKGAKLIHHAHNSLAPFQNRDLFKTFIADAYIFNSEAMRQEALNLLPYLRNTCTIHNGANESLFYPLAAGAGPGNPVPVVLFVGRLVPIKGVHVLLAAMKLLYERKIEAVCKIVGSSHAGGHRNKTTAYIKSLHDSCPPNVSFEGFRSGTHMGDVYRESNIFCCPSVWQEPFGSVNVEAMACGVPVVASHVGGIPEIASEGGVLMVEPDSPVALADALQRLILDPDLQATMAAEGIASFQRRFTWAAITNKQHHLVSRLLEAPRMDKVPPRSFLGNQPSLTPWATPTTKATSTR
jgi:spore coat protein SA